MEKSTPLNHVPISLDFFSNFGGGSVLDVLFDFLQLNNVTFVKSQ